MLSAIRITKKEDRKLPQNLTECSTMYCRQCCFEDYIGHDGHCSYRKMIRKYTLQS